MTSNVWDNFYRLRVIKIEFAEGSGYSSAVIYGNGNNQVAINIHIKIVNNKENNLPLTASDLQDRVYLCSYSSGAGLPSSWDVSNESGDYANPLEYGSSFPAPENKPQDEVAEPSEEGEDEKASSVITVTKYISVNVVNAGMAISAGVTIPGVGKFDTSQYGTDTPNAPPGKPGNVFKSPSYITVNVIQAVDYSLPASVTVSGRINGNGSYTLDVKDVKLERNQGLSDRHDGRISHSNGTIIKPAKEHLYFTRKKVLSKGIADLSGMTSSSGYNIDLSYKTPANRDAGSGEMTDVYAVFVDKKTMV